MIPILFQHIYHVDVYLWRYNNFLTINNRYFISLSLKYVNSVFNFECVRLLETSDFISCDFANSNAYVNVRFWFQHIVKHFERFEMLFQNLQDTALEK